MNPRGNAYAPHGHTGLTAHDAAIMAEWDAGRLPMRAIAHKLGLTPRRVEATVSCYDGRADHAAFCRDTRAASASLLAAIGQHFPERVAP